MMRREVMPELLDGLPEGDPSAVASRRDLRRINWIMGNYHWLARRAGAFFQEPFQLLELGAGDGGLARVICPRGCVATGLDRVARPRDWPHVWKWLQGDAREVEWEGFDAVCAVLFWHHFTDEELRAWRARVGRRTRVVWAVEPYRSRLHQWQVAALGVLTGLHPVTRHDARVSIAAGFRQGELPELLGLTRAHGWKVREQRTIFGAYRMEAVRIL